MQKVSRSASGLETGWLLWLVPSPWRRDKGSQLGAPYPTPTWPMEDPLNREPFALLANLIHSDFASQEGGLFICSMTCSTGSRLSSLNLCPGKMIQPWHAACVFLSKWALITCQWGYLAHPSTNLVTLDCLSLRVIFVWFHFLWDGGSNRGFTEKQICRSSTMNGDDLCNQKVTLFKNIKIFDMAKL